MASVDFREKLFWDWNPKEAIVLNQIPEGCCDTSSGIFIPMGQKSQKASIQKHWNNYPDVSIIQETKEINIGRKKANHPVSIFNPFHSRLWKIVGKKSTYFWDIFHLQQSSVFHWKRYDPIFFTSLVFLLQLIIYPDHNLWCTQARSKVESAVGRRQKQARKKKKQGARR